MIGFTSLTSPGKRVMSLAETQAGRGLAGISDVSDVAPIQLSLVLLPCVRFIKVTSLTSLTSLLIRIDVSRESLPRTDVRGSFQVPRPTGNSDRDCRLFADQSKGVK